MGQTDKFVEHCLAIMQLIGAYRPFNNYCYCTYIYCRLVELSLILSCAWLILPVLVTFDCPVNTVLTLLTNICKTKIKVDYCLIIFHPFLEQSTSRLYYECVCVYVCVCV